MIPLVALGKCLQCLNGSETKEYVMNNKSGTKMLLIAKKYQAKSLVQAKEH